jgi:hypothetical protein
MPFTFSSAIGYASLFARWPLADTATDKHIYAFHSQHDRNTRNWICIYLEVPNTLTQRHLYSPWSKDKGNQQSQRKRNDTGLDAPSWSHQFRHVLLLPPGDQFAAFACAYQYHSGCLRVVGSACPRPHRTAPHRNREGEPSSQANTEHIRTVPPRQLV